MGIYSALYKLTPHYVTKEDVIKTIPYDITENNFIVSTDKGLVGANNIAEVAALLKRNLTREEMINIANGKKNKDIAVKINRKYVNTFKEYLGIE